MTSDRSPSSLYDYILNTSLCFTRFSVYWTRRIDFRKKRGVVEDSKPFRSIWRPPSRSFYAVRLYSAYVPSGMHEPTLTSWFSERTKSCVWRRGVSPRCGSGGRVGWDSLESPFSNSNSVNNLVTKWKSQREEVTLLRKELKSPLLMTQINNVSTSVILQDLTAT